MNVNLEALNNNLNALNDFVKVRTLLELNGRMEAPQCGLTTMTERIWTRTSLMLKVYSTRLGAL